MERRHLFSDLISTLLHFAPISHSFIIANEWILSCLACSYVFCLSFGLDCNENWNHMCLLDAISLLPVTEMIPDICGINDWCIFLKCILDNLRRKPIKLIANLTHFLSISHEYLRRTMQIWTNLKYKMEHFK